MEDACEPRQDRLEAVLFDVGGVLQLLDHERVRRALRPVVPQIPEHLIDRAHYVAVAQEEGWQWARQEPASYDGYVRAYVQSLGVPIEQLDPAAGSFANQLSDGSGWTRVVEGAGELLRHLGDRCLKLGVVSNTLAGGVEKRLGEAAICQLGTGRGACVGVVVDSHELGFAKPEPAIFNTALAALDVEPEHAVFVGDSLVSDVLGAERVGMRAIHFDPLTLCPAEDHPHVRSLAQIPKALRLTDD